MSPGSAELDLVQRCRAGEQSAWAELVETYFGELIREARDQGASKEKAEWAVKMSFEIVFTNHLAKYERIEPHGWDLRNLLSTNVTAVLHPRWHVHRASPFE